MNHCQPFCPRIVLSLPTAESNGWRLKRYAILANGKKFDQKIASAALDGAIERLPYAGELGDENSNHGVSFQFFISPRSPLYLPYFPGNGAVSWPIFSKCEHHGNIQQNLTRA